VSISELRLRLDAGELSARELLDRHLAKIEEKEPTVHAFLRVTKDEARAQAAEADRRIAAGLAGPLTGIPMAVKDVLCVRGVETTAGSGGYSSRKTTFAAAAAGSPCC